MTPKEWAGALAILLLLAAVVYILFFRKDQFTAYAEKHRLDADDLTDGEKQVIEACAMGHVESRGEAIEIYRKYLGKVAWAHRSLHMRFMSEIDTPVPDLALKADLRDRLIKGRPDTENVSGTDLKKAW